MTIQRIAHTQGVLKVDVANCIESSGAVQAFARDVDTETIGTELDDRHACPLYGDGIAKLGGRAQEIFDLQFRGVRQNRPALD